VLRTRLLRVSGGNDHRRAVAGEFIGTAFLLAAVVGSGIMGERLAAGNVAIALLANALATGAALVALIVTFGPVSGAHFNPIVTLVFSRGVHGARTRAAFVGAQLAGAAAGVLLAHAMFEAPLVAWSHHVRSGPSQVLSEAVATFGLVGVIASSSRRTPAAVPFAVAAYIVAAYWFTASTSFANPAVTLARAMTDTFAGIRPADVPWFLAGQAAGAGSAAAFFGWLVPADAALDRRIA
jgi:glycerol uptake facilitator-like aquaporin